MSYCRFSEADAYIYDDVAYGLYCSVCSLMPTKTFYSDFFKQEITVNESFIAGYDYDKMIDHISNHRVAGDYIPEDVDERLIFERDCIHDFNHKGICEHCWRRDAL